MKNLRDPSKTVNNKYTGETVNGVAHGLGKFEHSTGYGWGVFHQG